MGRAKCTGSDFEHDMTKTVDGKGVLHCQSGEVTHALAEKPGQTGGGIYGGKSFDQQTENLKSEKAQIITATGIEPGLSETNKPAHGTLSS
jgi:uncharacterized protein YunC (DUF1805 family)